MIYIEYKGDYYPLGEITLWEYDGRILGIKINNKELRIKNALN